MLQSISALDLAVAGATAQAGAGAIRAGVMAGAIQVGAGVQVGAIRAGAGAIQAGAGVQVGAIRAGAGVQAGVTIHPITETIPTGNAMRTTRAGSIREMFTTKEH